MIEHMFCDVCLESRWPSGEGIGVFYRVCFYIASGRVTALSPGGLELRVGNRNVWGYCPRKGSLNGNLSVWGYCPRKGSLNGNRNVWGYCPRKGSLNGNLNIWGLCLGPGSPNLGAGYG